MAIAKPANSSMSGGDSLFGLPAGATHCDKVACVCLVQDVIECSAHNVQDFDKCLRFVPAIGQD